MKNLLYLISPERHALYNTVKHNIERRNDNELLQRTGGVDLKGKNNSLLTAPATGCSPLHAYTVTVSTPMHLPKQYGGKWEKYRNSNGVVCGKKHGWQFLEQNERADSTSGLSPRVKFNTHGARYFIHTEDQKAEFRASHQLTFWRKVGIWWNALLSRDPVSEINAMAGTTQNVNNREDIHKHLHALKVDIEQVPLLVSHELKLDGVTIVNAVTAIKEVPYFTPIGGLEDRAGNERSLYFTPSHELSKLSEAYLTKRDAVANRLCREHKKPWNRTEELDPAWHNKQLALVETKKADLRTQYEQDKISYPIYVRKTMAVENRFRQRQFLHAIKLGSPEVKQMWAEAEGIAKQHKALLKAELKKARAIEVLNIANDFGSQAIAPSVAQDRLTKLYRAFGYNQEKSAIQARRLVNPWVFNSDYSNIVWATKLVPEEFDEPEYTPMGSAQDQVNSEEPIYAVPDEVVYDKPKPNASQYNVPRSQDFSFVARDPKVKKDPLPVVQRDDHEYGNILPEHTLIADFTDAMIAHRDTKHPEVIKMKSILQQSGRYAMRNTLFGINNKEALKVTSDQLSQKKVALSEKYKAYKSLKDGDATQYLLFKEYATILGEVYILEGKLAKQIFMANPAMSQTELKLVSEVLKHKVTKEDLKIRCADTFDVLKKESYAKALKEHGNKPDLDEAVTSLSEAKLLKFEQSTQARQELEAFQLGEAKPLDPEWQSKRQWLWLEYAMSATGFYALNFQREQVLILNQQRKEAREQFEIAQRLEQS